MYLIDSSVTLKLWVCLRARIFKVVAVLRMREFGGRRVPLRDVNVGCDQGLLSLRGGRNQLHWAAVNSEAKRRGTERRYRSGGWIIQHTRARWRSHRSARVQLEVWCSSESGWWMLADGRTGRSLSAARRSVHPSSLLMSRCQWREESPGQTPGGVLGWDPCGVEGYQAICTCWRVTSDGCDR